MADAWLWRYSFGMIGRRLGFSLVELLVVIGVIVLLVAIALPIVSVVRSSALDTVCANRFREIGRGVEIGRRADGGLLPWRYVRVVSDDERPGGFRLLDVDAGRSLAPGVTLAELGAMDALCDALGFARMSGKSDGNGGTLAVVHELFTCPFDRGVHGGSRHLGHEVVSDAWAYDGSLPHWQQRGSSHEYHWGWSSWIASMSHELRMNHGLLSARELPDDSAEVVGRRWATRFAERYRDLPIAADWYPWHERTLRRFDALIDERGYGISGGYGLWLDGSVRRLGVIDPARDLEQHAARAQQIEAWRQEIEGL